MRLITKLRTASLLNTIWYQPSLLYGSGATYERSFERLLYQLDYDPAEFKRHPCGTNRWPDFHLLLDEKPQAIELKTTQSNTVCMGGTWPHPDCIYIIGHPTYVTIARGADLVTTEDRNTYDVYRTKQRDMLNRLDRISSSTFSVQTRTNIWIKIPKECRERWYQRTLQWIIC